MGPFAMRASSFLISFASILLVVAIASVASAEDDQPPSWFPMDTFHAVEDVPLIMDFTEFVTDPDTPTDNLTIDSGSPFVVNISGMVVTFLFPNGVLEANVTMEVSDGNATKRATLHFVIEPVNDPPIWQPRLERLPDGEQDEFYSFNLTATDEDTEVEDLTFFTDANFFIISPTGEIAFRPTNDVVGPNWFNVTVYDPGGLFDTMELFLFIETYPEWDTIWISTLEARVGEVFRLNISDFLVYQGTGYPPQVRLTFTYYDDTTLLETDPETGEVVWDVPTPEDVGDHFFTITVVNSEGRADQMEIKITVPLPDPPPIFGPIEAQDLTEDVRYTFTMPLDPHYETYSKVYGGFTFSNEPGDPFEIDPDTGVIDLVPRNEDVGTWAVSLKVLFDNGLEEVVPVVFNVHNVNDVPTIDHVVALELIEGEQFELHLEGHDTDMDMRMDGTRLPVDPEERLRFSGGLDGGHLDPVTGVWTIVPDQGHVNASPLVVDFKVMDAGGLSDSVKVRLSVVNRVTQPSAMIVGVVEGQKLNVGKKLILRAGNWDESGEEWATSLRWFANNRQIGTDPAIEWEPRGSGIVDLALVAEDTEGNKVRTNLTVLVRPNPAGGYIPWEPFAAFLLVVVTSVGLALLYNWRKDNMRR